MMMHTLNVREELALVRAKYEMQDTCFLMNCLRNQGVDGLEVMDMDRAEMLDKLMALEEHAAFH